MENIKKPATIKSLTLEDADYKAISKFSLVDEIDREKIFAFKVVLCNNEVDRDFEAFTTEALKGLAAMFIGKTGIKDHSMRSDNQMARIYKTEVVVDEAKTTSYGEPFAELTACAYMVRMSSNENLITEIEMGIKKEVSVSCALTEATCSICGNDLRKSRCEHKLGADYNGAICFAKLNKPVDAYEWSFVAVPAQVGAGTTKNKVSEERESYPDAVKAVRKNNKTIKDTLIRAFSNLEEF